MLQKGIAQKELKNSETFENVFKNPSRFYGKYYLETLNEKIYRSYQVHK